MLFNPFSDDIFQYFRLFLIGVYVGEIAKITMRKRVAVYKIVSSSLRRLSIYT